MSAAITTEQAPRDGYGAARLWWQALCAREAAVQPYAFPSELKECALALPPEHLSQFLDAIGEMIVTWKTAGEPAECYPFSRARVDFCRLSPQEQDAQWDDACNPVTDIAREMLGLPQETESEANHD